MALLSRVHFGDLHRPQAHDEKRSRLIRDGEHEIKVRVRDSAGSTAEDSISILVNQAGRYDAPARHSINVENAIGAYPAKNIPGGQLGPNKNGTKGPWPSWRKQFASPSLANRMQPSCAGRKW
jgi:hypothetical protein